MANPDNNHPEFGTRCKQCGAWSSQGHQYCQQCGAPLGVEDNGLEQDDEDDDVRESEAPRYCPYCSARVAHSTSESVEPHDAALQAPVSNSNPKPGASGRKAGSPPNPPEDSVDVPRFCTRCGASLVGLSVRKGDGALSARQEERAERELHALMERHQLALVAIGGGVVGAPRADVATDAEQYEQAEARQRSQVEDNPVTRGRCRNFTAHELKLRAACGFQDFQPMRRQLSEAEMRQREMAGLPPEMLFEEEQ